MGAGWLIVGILDGMVLEAFPVYVLLAFGSFWLIWIALAVFTTMTLMIVWQFILLRLWKKHEVRHSVGYERIE
jgi:hypothetical protein